MMRYVAAERGLRIKNISISVEVTLQGDPITATDAILRVMVHMADGSDSAELGGRTSELSIAMNSLHRGHIGEGEGLADDAISNFGLWRRIAVSRISR
ncbi:hypothetical protein FHS85_000806 [Rhodoligotrophos appendicifer]|uniref:hypothetical protein n=1 Tax=Rhodoligotrophos appendicifer TaxID=987056 RepID=UPI001186E90F|nr:hypothetical protein [Rhodoligotrophos appendicifer]